MQIDKVEELITEIYNSMSTIEKILKLDKQRISKDYVSNQKTLHDTFWQLHAQLQIPKNNVRIAIANFTEASNKMIEILMSIKDLIERDKQNKKNALLKKANEEKAKLMEKLKSLELEKDKLELEEKKIDAMKHLS